MTINIHYNLDINERETKRFLAAKLYEPGRLSFFQSAELAGKSGIAFSEILTDYGVSFINCQPTDLTRDAAQF